VRHIPVAALAFAALALSACGLSQVDAPSASPAPATVSPATPYPTLSPAPKVPETSFPPCAPIPRPTPWLDDSAVQVGPDSWDDFVASNYYLGPDGNSDLSSFQVWAGMTGDAASPAGVPVVWVDVLTIGSDRCSTSTSMVGEFTDPGAGSPLTITSVRGSVVSLRTARGLSLTFSLSSHRFSATRSVPTG
jgi:hypothetical protein